MNRTQIYLSEPQQVALAALARERRTTSSALIRSAIDGYLTAQLSPRQRVAAMRELATELATGEAVSAGAAAVESLRGGDSDRLSSRA